MDSNMVRASITTNDFYRLDFSLCPGYLGTGLCFCPGTYNYPVISSVIEYRDRRHAISMMSISKESCPKMYSYEGLFGQTRYPKRYRNLITTKIQMEEEMAIHQANMVCTPDVMIALKKRTEAIEEKHILTSSHIHKSDQLREITHNNHIWRWFRVTI